MLKMTSTQVLDDIDKSYIPVSLKITQNTKIDFVLYCPIQTEININLNSVRQHCFEWASHSGLLNISDEKSVIYFKKADFGLLCSYCYRDLNEEALNLVAEWITFLFPHDDTIDTQINKIGNSNKQARNMNKHINEVLIGKSEMDQNSSLSKAAYNIRNKLLKKEITLSYFFHEINNYFKATLWEAELRNKRILPSISEYINMRQYTGGVYTVFEIGCIAGSIKLSDRERNSFHLNRLAQLANNSVCYINDLFSLKKELYEGSMNLIMIKAKNDEVSLMEAANYLVQLYNKTIVSFLKIENNLPQILRQSDSVLRYLQLLKGWIRGNIDWSLRTGRYNK